MVKMKWSLRKNMHIEYRVKSDNENQRVAQILKNHLKFSRGQLRRVKRCAGVMVNHQTVRLNTLVKEGDLIRVNFQEDTEQPVVPQEIPLKSLFEKFHKEFQLKIGNAPSLDELGSNAQQNYRKPSEVHNYGENAVGSVSHELL